jgi:hypothetical protein
MDAPTTAPAPTPPTSFETHPSRYKHWKLTLSEGGTVATLTMAVDGDHPHRPGYELKLNSYDLSVDIELWDAIQRLRFEQPQVRALVFAADLDRVFCSGANIYMLGLSTHSFKVNFCKFTNETRCTSRTPAPLGLRSIAACQAAPPPAVATSWRWRATRSCWSTTATRRCRSPRRRCWRCCLAPAA